MLKKWRAPLRLGLLAGLLLIASALFLNYSRKRKPDLEITFLGYTNVLLRASLEVAFTMPKLMFSISNSSTEQISIASISQVYPWSEYPAHLDSYLMVSRYSVDPGEAIVESMLLPTNDPPWQFKLAYSSPGFKGRLIQSLGGRGTFMGRNAGAIVDIFSPTQKLRWIRVELPGSGKAAAPNSRRFHITAPPPPFKSEWLTNKIESSNAGQDQ